MLSLNLRYAYAWKFNLRIPICSCKYVVMVALEFIIKACQTSATSFAVLQNPQWLCNLHELHNRELHSPLSSIYANNRQMSQHHPNQLCFPWSLSVLLKTILYWSKKCKVKDICLEFWEYFSHVFKHYEWPCCQGQRVSGWDFATHFLQTIFINTTHFASVNSYTSSYQLSFCWKLKTGNHLHPSLHPAKALWKSHLQVLISWESANSFCSFVSSI